MEIVIEFASVSRPTGSKIETRAEIDGQLLLVLKAWMVQR